jgi:hypothetical protein
VTGGERLAQFRAAVDPEPHPVPGERPVQAGGEVREQLRGGMLGGADDDGLGLFHAEALQHGLSRFVFPAKDTQTALDQIGTDVHAAAQRFSLRGAFPQGISQDEALRRFHCFYGHPDEIIAALRQEQVLPVATDLITQFNPAVPDHDAAIRALELIATEVAPALGWKPAHDSPGVPQSSGLRQLTGA